MLFMKLLTNRAQMFADVRTFWSADAVKRVTGYDIEGVAKEAGGFIHLINSGACCLDACGEVKDENGNITEILATYDPESRGGDPADGRKVKGATIHWVNADDCADAEIRVYENLFADADPDGADKDYIECMNPNSHTVLTGCKVEKMLENAVAPAHFQFLRNGYFCVDNKDSAPGHLVFNRAVALKDSFKM